MIAVGFVGLGNMGSALAMNLLGAGFEVLAHDLAGPDRCPDGAAFVTDIGIMAASVSHVVLSLPDGAASHAVAEAIRSNPRSSVTQVIDTSTVGLDAARAIAHLLGSSGIGHVDAPVSGGVAGARNRTLSVMYSGAVRDCESALPVLEGLSDRRFHVGDAPGMAQAVKLANNFLSATALAATSEAVGFCTSVGLEMATVLDVLNASSGRSAATEDKFVNHVLTGTYSSGFLNTLMAKDVRLYLDAVASQATPSTLGQATSEVWQRFAAAQPATDFTAVHRFVNDG